MKPESATIEYVLYGEPRAWSRAGARGGHRFTPKAVREEQAMHREGARGALGERPWPIMSPMALHIVCYLGTARRVDIDNLAKLVLDALNGHAFHDDSQVVRLVAEKHLDREDPRTEVRVIALGDTP